MLQSVVVWPTFCCLFHICVCVFQLYFIWINALDIICSRVRQLIQNFTFYAIFNYMRNKTKCSHRCSFFITHPSALLTYICNIFFLFLKKRAKGTYLFLIDWPNSWKFSWQRFYDEIFDSIKNSWCYRVIISTRHLI